MRQRLAKLMPGAELPSDAELCEEFGVSRMTARHAMNRLAGDGLVFRVRGRGTFVGDPPTHRRANSLLSFSNEMRRQGRVPTSQVLGRGLRAPTREEAARLRLKKGEKVLWLKRIRLADGEPIALESTRLHPATAVAVLRGGVGARRISADQWSGHHQRRARGCGRCALVEDAQGRGHARRTACDRRSSRPASRVHRVALPGRPLRPGRRFCGRSPGCRVRGS